MITICGGLSVPLLKKQEEERKRGRKGRDNWLDVVGVFLQEPCGTHTFVSQKKDPSHFYFSFMHSGLGGGVVVVKIIGWFKVRFLSFL